MGIRDCPAAVSGNDRRHQHWPFRAGKRRPVGPAVAPRRATAPPTSPKTCHRPAAAMAPGPTGILEGGITGCATASAALGSYRRRPIPSPLQLPYRSRERRSMTTRRSGPLVARASPSSSPCPRRAPIRRSGQETGRAMPDRPHPRSTPDAAPIASPDRCPLPEPPGRRADRVARQLVIATEAALAPFAATTASVAARARQQIQAMIVGDLLGRGLTEIAARYQAIAVERWPGPPPRRSPSAAVSGAPNAFDRR